MRLPTLCYAAVVLGSLTLSSQVSAATALRNHFSHGTANCQSALPVFDGNIRKRPMAVANEGSSTAFITCDSENNEESFGGMQEVGVYFTNRSGANGLTVSCTLVNGVYSGTFFPKPTAAIPAGGYGFITWTAADNGGAKFVAPAVSCGLPAGVELNYVNFVYPEEVGP